MAYLLDITMLGDLQRIQTYLLDIAMLGDLQRIQTYLLIGSDGISSPHKSFLNLHVQWLCSFFSALFSCLLAFDIGKSIFFSPSCASISPIAKFDASMCTLNINPIR